MEQKTKLEVLVGGLLILGAVLVLLAGYSWISGMGEKDSGADQNAVFADSLTEVLTAARPLPRGAVLTKADGQVIAISGDVPAGVVLASANIKGQIATRDIVAGQFLMQQMLTERPEEAGLAAVVPEGYRAVALRVSDDIAVSNLIRPGDRVDILLVLKDSNLPDNDAGVSTSSGGQGRSFGGGSDLTGDDSEAHTLLQNIEVLTVGDLIKGAESEEAQNYRTLTVAVLPQQANRIALARAVGQYALAMRPVGDDQIGAGATVTISDIRGSDAPAKKKQERQRALKESEQPVAGRHQVQIINGARSGGGTSGGLSAGGGGQSAQPVLMPRQ